METAEEYHNRRVREVQDRIKILENYINNNSYLERNEVGVGGSYKRRRNSRTKANKDYRISQFKGEIEGLERVLRMHRSKINCL